MTTCKVHNVKFYKLDPKGINCMVFEKKRKKLALSRSDATIEIWDLSHTPYIERTIPSRSNGSIEALCWYNKRLFSVGLHGQLIEYDLCNLSQKYAIPITGGVGWCMDIHQKTSTLVIGTEQGYINLYQITDDGVEYIKVLDKQEGRLLCLKFDATGNFIASGSANAVRIWNVSSGHAIHKMNLSQLTNKTETVVWCLAITDDFTVITGDTRGYITFWDGETGSQIESYKSHNAAILSVCLSEDQNIVYSAGVDPLIMSYERVNMKGKSDKWVKSIQRKIHDHDVRTLVFADNKLYSGGVDGYLACSYYPPRTLVRYPPVLQNPCISVSHEKKYILLRYQKSIEVWRFGEEASEENVQGILKLKEEPKKLLELQTKGEEGTLCSSISNNGQFIVYSSISKLRVFHFNYKDESDPELTPIDNLPEECSSCVRAEFTPNSKQLILAPTSGGIQVLNISGNQLYLSQVIDTSSYLEDTITFLNISTCGKYLVAADPESNIVVWSFIKNSWVHHCTLPRYQCPPTALGIHPKTKDLLVVYTDHKIIEYNLKQKKFTDFSRGLDEKHPRQLLNRSFPVINVTFDPQAEHIILLHDDSTICVIDKEKKLPTSGAKIPKLDSSFINEGRLPDHAFHIIKKYKHLVYFGWLSEGELVSVEVSPLSLLEKLPPCLQQNKFGTK